jgi:hypothetical protein
MERSQAPKWRPSPQPIGTQLESLDASTSGAEAPAATLSVVSLTRERRIERESPPFAPHEPFHGELWFASCARSLRPLIQSTIGMCKPHQRCADNRSHHAGCVCRAVQRASYILRCVRYLFTNQMLSRISRHASYNLVVYVSAAS